MWVTKFQEVKQLQKEQEELESGEMNLRRPKALKRSSKTKKSVELTPPPTIYRLDSKIWDKPDNNRLQRLADDFMLDLKERADKSIKEVDELEIRDSIAEKHLNNSVISSSDDEENFLLAVNKGKK